MRVADFHQANRSGVKLSLVFAKDLPDAPLPNVPPNSCRIRFTAHHDPDHGLVFRRQSTVRIPFRDPQIKKLSSGELSAFDEIFEGRLSADPLTRAEPFLRLQSLYLG